MQIYTANCVDSFLLTHFLVQPTHMHTVVYHYHSMPIHKASHHQTWMHDSDCTSSSCTATSWGCVLAGLSHDGYRALHCLRRAAVWLWLHKGKGLGLRDSVVATTPNGWAQTVIRSHDKPLFHEKKNSYCTALWRHCTVKNVWCRDTTAQECWCPWWREH